MSESRTRLDVALVKRGIVATRSQAESYIKLGSVTVNGNTQTKASTSTRDEDKIRLTAKEQYVSRAGLKLASIADQFELDFRDQIILDVGSSTGGFTDFALQHGAKKVVAVEVGKEQLHPSLRGNEKIELHEQTDIRNYVSTRTIKMDIVVIDVSFVSLRDILPHVAKVCSKTTQIVAMVKPQFEAESSLKHKGVIKNDRMRRDILSAFELWAKSQFVISKKADSLVAGAKGNVERFYLLHTNR